MFIELGWCSDGSVTERELLKGFGGVDVDMRKDNHANISSVV
jgi:hypothetical protein